ncbi:MAG: PHP domain-containing protein [Luminiphilus sp.]|nr:PHP domain-containing protein [Luminiphilus sp.]
MIVDFHTHTSASDGALSPEQLLQRAVDAGVQHFSITDHDTLAGYLQVCESPLAKRVGLVPGVELSCRWAKSTIHIVGLNFSPTATEMVLMVEQLTKARRKRAKTIADCLAGVGIPNALEGAIAVAAGSQIGRPHFAQWMVDTGVVSSLNQAFARYLGNGKVGDVKAYWPSLAEVTEAIVASGGEAIMAHPLKYRLTGVKLRALLNDFVSSGGTALEVLNGRQIDAERRRLVTLASSLGLKVSVGSDFHKDLTYGAPVGVAVDSLNLDNSIWQPWLVSK